MGRAARARWVGAFACRGSTNLVVPVGKNGSILRNFYVKSFFVVLHILPPDIGAGRHRFLPGVVHQRDCGRRQPQRPKWRRMWHVASKRCNFFVRTPFVFLNDKAFTNFLSHQHSKCALPLLRKNRYTTQRETPLVEDNVSTSFARFYVRHNTRRNVRPSELHLTCVCTNTNSFLNVDINGEIIAYSEPRCLCR